MRTFKLEYILLLWWKTQQDAAEVVVGKRLFKNKGPYVVLRQMSPNSYLICRILFTEVSVNQGWMCKAIVSILVWIPSILCVHKQSERAGRRSAVLGGSVASNPLQNILFGVILIDVYYYYWSGFINTYGMDDIMLNQPIH